MSNHNASLQKAIDIVGEAIREDQESNWEKALGLYNRALEYFMHHIKYEKNAKAKEMITLRVKGYMDRAEQIKKIIDEGNKPKKKRRASANGDEDDKEKDKLQDSLMSSIIQDKPNVKWDDVAGLEGAKTSLKEAVILPARFPQLFTGKRRPWKGILLYGPPGTGKSYLAKAVATEADSTFFSVSSADLVSKYVGESEKLIKTLFEMAREKKPSIIFIDEIDSLCSARGEGESESARRIKTEFLVQMQGVGKSHDGILVLGATNVPWELDPAMRRRFEKRIYISLPDRKARSYMMKLHLGDTPNNLLEDDFNNLADDTDGYSGSDLSVVVREALMEPLRQCQIATHFKKVNDSEGVNGYFYMPCKANDRKAEKKTLMDIGSEELKCPDVVLQDFQTIIGRGGGATVSPSELVRFEKWTAQFGSDGSG
jgi:vacuolar protein-sorting-associated protein 4